MNRRYHYFTLLVVMATLSFPLLAIPEQDDHPRQDKTMPTGDVHQQAPHDNRKTPDDGRVYDRTRHDYHSWNDDEDRAYRKYLIQNHKPYREFERNSRKEQSRYWTWRHAHPDHKNRTDHHR